VVWALLGMIVFALVTDLIFYTGYYASDDRQYLTGAWQLAESGRLSSVTLGTIRLMLVAPLALVARLTDRNLFLMTASVAVYHLLVVVGTYWVGRLVHGLATGLLAAGLIAICPLAVVFATMIVPDHEVTALSLLAAGCLLVAGRRLTGNARGVRSAGALCALGGFLFGLACGAKITAIVLVPVFAALLLSWARLTPLRRVLRAGLWFLLGTAAAVLLLWVLFYTATGLYSPLQDSRMATLLGPAPGRTVTKPYYSFGGRWERLVGFAAPEGRVGIPALAGALALLGYPLLRRRSWGLCLTFLWVCVYMTWGTFSLSRYRPPPMQIRYFIFALPLLMVMLALELETICRWLWRRLGVTLPARRILLAAAVVGCLLAVTVSYLMLNRIAGKYYYAAEVAGARHALDFATGSGERPVVMSYWLSDRMWPLLQTKRWSGVVTSPRGTTRADMRNYLASGFLYLDCEREQVEDRWAATRSPLDLAIQEALAGRDEALRVRTIGSFGQFETRFAALRRKLNGSQIPAAAGKEGRRVFVREVVGSPGRPATTVAPEQERAAPAPNL
jgi:4-amino-4-deoxy-L-arabinose transferase-like glycosyltransferase